MNHSFFKTIRVTPLVLTTLLCAGISGSVGCATRGYEKAAAASDAVADASTQVEVAHKQIDEATTSLHALIDSPPADMKSSFEHYRTAVATLDTTVGQLGQQADEMAKQGRSYFDTWDQRLSQMSNEDIRARSAARQHEVTTQFTDIQERYQQARQELARLMPGFRDIQTAIGVDLTSAGIQSARDFVPRTDASAVAAKAALDRLAEGMRGLRSSLTPVPSKS